MKYRVLAFTLVFLVMIAFLAACGVTEPSPTLMPPPTPLTDGPPPPIVVEGVTVAADEGARETAVTESSPTPVETPTLAPTVTPTIDNQDEGLVEIVASGPLPASSQDLLLIAAGSLKRWGRNGQVQTLVPGGNEAASEVPRSTEPIVGDVTGYSVSADGRRAAVVRLTASTEISNTLTAVTETIHTYELSYLNLETNSSRVLAPAISGQGQPFFQLSPDGRHVAFSAQSLGAANMLTLGEEITGELFVVETESGLPPEKVGDCIGICQNPVWHQDNNDSSEKSFNRQSVEN